MDEPDVELAYQWLMRASDGCVCPKCMHRAYWDEMEKVGLTGITDVGLPWVSAVILHLLLNWWMLPVRIPLTFLSTFYLWLGADVHNSVFHEGRRPSPTQLPSLPPPVPPGAMTETAMLDMLVRHAAVDPERSRELIAAVLAAGAVHPDWLKSFREEIGA